jgi:hypothetical protein
MNFLVEEPLILHFIPLEKNKFQKKNLKKKLFVQHGVLMGKLFHLEQLLEQFHSDKEILTKKYKYIKIELN